MFKRKGVGGSKAFWTMLKNCTFLARCLPEKIIYILLCCWFWFDKIFSTSGCLVVLIGSSTSSSGSPTTQTRKRAYALIRRKNQHGQRLGLMLIWDIPKHEEIWDPELINETNSQHEAKRKKFQNQDSVISEKFASKVKHHTIKIFEENSFFITGRDPRSPGWLNISYFHQSSGKNILSLLNVMI